MLVLKGIYADVLTGLCTSTPETAAQAPEQATGTALRVCRGGSQAQWRQKQMKTPPSRGLKRFEVRSGLEIPVGTSPASGYPRYNRFIICQSIQR